MLVQAKAASALVCLALFAAQDQHLIYLANAAIDGTIAVLVWVIALRGSARDDVPVTTTRHIGMSASIRPGRSAL